MASIEITLDEETLICAKWLAKAHNCTISELITEGIKRLSLEEGNTELVKQMRKEYKLLQSINEAYADGLDASEQAMLEGMRRHQQQLQEQE